MAEVLTGEIFKNALLSGANVLKNHSAEVDALNVFPVPDGDTGTNMSMTIDSAAGALRVTEETTLFAIAKTTAGGLLRGARGNSGVILSLIFRGISKGLKGLESADGLQLAAAFDKGRESAYKAVMNPTEGTILTVVRLAAEKALATAEEDYKKTFVTFYEAAQAALLQTPEMLPVLKEAGVVDAGGQGFLYVLEGMKSYILDGVLVPLHGEEESGEDSATSQKTYAYSVKLAVPQVKSTQAEVEALQNFLKNDGLLKAFSFENKKIVLHQHTDDPSAVLEAAMKFGAMQDIEILNIAKQGEPELDTEEAPTEALQRVEPEKEYGFVAIAAGDGVRELFMELGADIVVAGGQTMNPSTDDILQAIEATPARHVFVLPNNKNIIMAAEQAIPLADRGVSVLATKTIPQGITAILSFDESLSAEENHLEMMKAAEGVHTAQVTFAARDSEFNGERITKGQMLGMEDGKITLIEDDLVQTAYRVTRRLVKKYDGSILTILYGEDTDEATANALAERLQARFPNVEINVVNGGQPVYYFMVSVE